jgi:multiple sugar transport system permease protein
MASVTKPADGGGLSKLTKKLGWTRSDLYRAKWGFIFISPWIIGFLAFYHVPMVASFVLSLYRFDVTKPDEASFIGLENWQRLLFQDPDVWISLGITFKFAFITLPIGFAAAIFLAILLNSEELIGKNIFRTLFYAPTMVPLIAAIFIWNGVLNPHTGWVNRLIDLTGIQATGTGGLRWFNDPSLIYFAYTFVGLWGIGNTMLITLAGLQGVPTALYEAALIDGAGWWSRLWNITLPMVSPVLFYNLVLGVIGLMQYFIVPWVLTQGSGYPEGTTRFYMIYFYKQTFTFNNMGYGATLAWFMFAVALALTVFLFSTARHWVHYAGE